MRTLFKRSHSGRKESGEGWRSRKSARRERKEAEERDDQAEEAYVARKKDGEKNVPALPMQHMYVALMLLWKVAFSV